jgi:hypothetical protein
MFFDGVAKVDSDVKVSVFVVLDEQLKKKLYIYFGNWRENSNCIKFCTRELKKMNTFCFGHRKPQKQTPLAREFFPSIIDQLTIIIPISELPVLQVFQQST